MHKLVYVGPKFVMGWAKKQVSAQPPPATRKKEPILCHSIYHAIDVSRELNVVLFFLQKIMASLPCCVVLLRNICRHVGVLIDRRTCMKKGVEVGLIALFGAQIT